jgi:CheY-like chemotaxis protein
VSPENLSPLATRDSIKATPDGSLRILVVDDELAILNVLSGMLCSLGHSVYSFTGCSNRDALSIREMAVDVRFEVAILDIIMPGMSGMELAELIYRASPSTEFIISSTGADLCKTALEYLKDKKLSVQSLLMPFERGDLEGRLDIVISSRKPNLRSAADQEDQESNLKIQAYGAVRSAMCNFSSIGMPCNEYVSHCKTIGDFVWRHFPYASEKRAISLLNEMLSMTIAPAGKTSLCPEMAESIFSSLPPPFKGTNFQVITNTRPYLRYCLWCSREIAKKQQAWVLYGAKNRKVRPRFCSEDCYQNWESDHWQRVALPRLGLTEKELLQEQKNLKRDRWLRR